MDTVTPVVLLDRETVAAPITLDDCIPVVEAAFAAYATGRALQPGVLHVDADGGEFHIKVGGLRGGRTYFARKVNGGAFIAAVGADSPDRQEVTSELVAGSSVVCDLLEQCVRVGESCHAIAAGLMNSDQIRCELGAHVAGSHAGARTTTKSSSSIPPGPHFRTSLSRRPSTRKLQRS